MVASSTIRFVYSAPVRDMRDASVPERFDRAQTSFPYNMEDAISLMERGVVVLELERLKRAFRTGN